jgi:dTDP-L-rhamnose 4-epimerase
LKKRILITGGAGFIGSHLADRLLSRGHTVRLFDNLSEQVHGDGAVRPSYLDPELELIIGDIRDSDAVRRALSGIDVVIHLAAMVGVGQSMYEIEKYTSVNDIGTAVLLEALIERPVEKLIVASSMSIYGEGLYQTRDGEITAAAERTLSDLKQGRWETCDSAGNELIPLPTPETKQPALSSVYALSKYDQERLCLMIGSAYDIPTVAMRFFNVFGTRQALSNPYTGVLAIFASRLLNNNRPMIFEDGEQKRDFVSVYDVAEACALAMETNAADGQAINIGSGRAFTIGEIARSFAQVLGREHLTPEITGQYRVGDIRHCYSDITKARELLGFEPSVTLEVGMIELAGWLAGETAIDRVDQARSELMARGLAV